MGYNNEPNMEVMTPREVSRFLKLPLSTVYKLSQDGRIRGTKLGKHWRYLQSDIQRYLQVTVDLNGNSQGIPSSVDRRRFPRTNCSIPSRFQVEIPRLKRCQGSGTIRNLSRGGALLEIDEIKVQGQFIKVDDPILIYLDSNVIQSKLAQNEIRGRIARIHANAKAQLGLQFATLSSETGQALTDLLSSLEIIKAPGR